MMTGDDANKANALNERLSAEFDEWFARLQVLANTGKVPIKLRQEDWGGRWFDQYTPEEALADGPED